MHNLKSFIKEFRIPQKDELKQALASFSKKQFRIFSAIFIVAFVSVLVMLTKINNTFMVYIPANGGTLTEGIIGMPTLVNPVLAISDADKDITSLVYSGLMRKMPDGTFVPDLAESYTVSPDGTVYTFTIKKKAKFHDGKSLNADDVIFTIEKIEDPLIKSPRKLGWDGVSVSKTDDYTVVFTLKKPYISFMDNTTIGILPSHIWKNITPAEFGLSQYNINAIGSGPYKVSSINKNKDNIPNEYSLKYFKEFTLGSPHITNLNIISYSNEKDLVEGLASHSIDQAGGISPENSKTIEESGYTLHTATLPRMFGLFFNSSKNKIFNDPQVIRALDTAIDRNAVVDQVLNGYGVAIKSPIPENLTEENLYNGSEKYSVDDANKILDNAGWVLGKDGIRTKGGTKTVTKKVKVGKKIVTQTTTVKTNDPVVSLSFSITTGNTPELKQAALLLKDQLAQIGVQVDVKKVYETGPLNQLIRSRDYEALFFGQVVNHESDLFSFWHSSQQTDPGLNIAMYNNKKVDTILENIQKTLSYDTRLNLYKNLSDEFNNSIPALLIYSPKYIYATSSKLNNVQLNTITVPSDRFALVYTWYANEDHVWKIFTK